MTVTAEIISVNVNVENSTATVNVNVQICSSAEITKEAIDEAIGASAEGSATKFYNEQGNFVEVGSTATEFELTIAKEEVEWDGLFIKISHSVATNDKLVKDISFKIDTASGILNLTPIVIYPSRKTYNGIPYQGFLLRDLHGRLTPDTNFDTLYLNYNVVDDTVSKYDTKFKLTGNGVISNHSTIGGGTEHSRFCTEIYKSISGETDVVRTELDADANYSQIDNSFQAEYARQKDCNAIFSPYVNGGVAQDYYSNSDLLEVASHYDNTFTRHDLTADEETFLNNVIAVNAHAFDIENHENATSYGYGLEFSEDMSKYRLNTLYPNNYVENYICGYTTNEDGTILTSTLHPTFVTINDLQIGYVVWAMSGETKVATSYITEILGENSIRVSPALPISESVVVYAMSLVKIGNAIGGSYDETYHGTESWACPFVLAKFKLIKKETGASWQQIRMACRATATNGGIWDLYTGFGIIDVDAAIEYINENYQTDEIIEEYAEQLENDRGIFEKLNYDNIKPNSPLPKHIVEDKFSITQEKIENTLNPSEETTITDGDFYWFRTVAGLWKKITHSNLVVKLASIFKSITDSNNDLENIILATNHSNRVVGDAGAPTVDNESFLTAINYYKAIESDIKLFYFPHLTGNKIGRTFTGGSCVSKGYSRDVNKTDLTQTTSTSQPVLCGKIAPNDILCVKNANGGSNYLRHNTISFGATDKWSVTIALNNNDSDVLYNTLCGEYNSTNNFLSLKWDSNLIAFRNSSGNLVKGIINLSKYIGKNILYTFVANGDGYLNVYLNGIFLETISNSTSIVFDSLLFCHVIATYNYKGLTHAYIIKSYAPSATEIAEEYAVLRALIPEIPSVQIGTQTWAVSNCEMAATPMGNIIPEMQAASNIEKVIGGNFESGLIGTKTSGDEVSTWILNTTNPISGTQDGRLQITTIGTISYRPHIDFSLSSITQGKYYKISFNYKINSGIAQMQGLYLGLYNSDSTLLSGSGTFTRYLQANGSAAAFWIYIDGRNLVDIQFDNISVQEVGWSDSQNLYDYIYANTSGTDEEKTYAAVKAAAMWCHYNNSVDTGAIYGKLYNWFAVKLLQMDIDYYNAANPTTPWGWRVPTQADFNTLATTLGGASVAGGKMKVTGTTYWSSPNTGATNESGFSAIGGGRRSEDGSFTLFSSQFQCVIIDGVTSTNSNTSILYIDTLNKLQGRSLRLIKT